MDEILIEEKRYVSSKRAAKMTGYAKDYIGQLCREGRVPARLVGRSWYVLESAIQDHRFGTPDVQEEKTSKEEEVASQMPTDTWQSPQYEATDVEMLPSLNRTEYKEIGKEPAKENQNIHDSWKEWFDRISDIPAAEPIASSEAEIDSSRAYEEEKKESDIEEDAVVAVPLRVVSQPLPRELLPQTMSQASIRSPQQEGRAKSTQRGVAFTRSVQVVGALVAVASLALATVGSGYFDEYVMAHTKASMLTGAVIYSR